MKNWDDWSDLQVNRKVAEFDGGYIGDVHDCGDKVMVSANWHGVTCHEEKDYCGSWADIGPLIQSNGITIEHDCETVTDNPAEWWNVYGLGIDGRVTVKFKSNPLRSAAIVFMMMKGVKPCSQS